MYSREFAFYLSLMVTLWLPRLSVSQESVINKKAEGDKPRSLAELIRTMDQATVKDGFVLRLYANEEVRQLQETTADHNRRHEEYAEKKQLLAKRTNALNRNSPPNFSRTLSSADRLFVRYDKDADGVLNQQEVTAMPTSTKGIDANSDERIEKQEFLRWMISRMNVRGARPVPRRADPFAAVPAAPPGVRAGRPPASEKEIDDMIAEQEAIAELQTKLRNEYKEAVSYRPPQTFYRIMETTDEFIRLRNDKEERIIPISSIKEFRRSVKE